MKSRKVKKTTREKLLSMIMTKAGINLNVDMKPGYISTSQLKALAIYIESLKMANENLRKTVVALTESSDTSHEPKASKSTGI